MSFRKRAALDEYKGVNEKAAVEYADNVQLIQMLFSALQDALSDSVGNIQRGDLKAKSKSITRAQTILGGLRMSLDFDRGGELARNLDELYDYANRRIVDANVENDEEILKEVRGIIQEISSAWQMLPSLMKPQETVAA
tara:strand:- start:44 stop:460 length:417 start_codon:yes stop_codon:yes gene_type:complete